MAALAGLTLFSYLRMKSIDREYTALSYDDLSLYNARDRWRVRFNVFLFATIAAWLLNAGDAALFAPRPIKKIYNKITVRPFMGYDGKRVCAGISFGL